MMVAGLVTVFASRFGLRFVDDIFEVLPGIAVGLLVYAVGRMPKRN